MSHAGEEPSVAAKYHTEPLVVPVVSCFIPVRDRAPRGIFSPLPPGAREDRVAVPTREIVCYECGQRSHIPEAALSAHCVHCRAHLSTAHVELKPGTRRLTVRTLGDVSLPAGVELSHLSIICRHLSIAGKGSGTLRCSGTLTLRGEAVVEGAVQAGSIIVTPGARVRLSPSAVAAQAEVEGYLTGCLQVAGEIRIGRGGVLEGDCRARQLIVEPGGRHAGVWVRSSLA
ncbi:MAG: polymer-forming cytoskeletal protein [Akkermansiaceae bacterium]|nr:polymer-forming cytoskeletal protein [Akkermansiaceae bacterium]